MKYITFSKNKVKNYFLAMTYFVLGVWASGGFTSNLLMVFLGAYLAVSALYLHSLIEGRKNYVEEEEYESDSNN
ncbi:hypothetical protein [Enterococcus phoeniculicola]|uniref:Uncharacterized protein n=1 Tax=Enterococcus phoeniculicola ATCC BAA-412 TaxID=1158610 RepID=R3W3J8_9ENTE|nr:hypothetical protein [Enterococcus phoeniculicola]EOL42031.1 hypothetical protein UC3_02379 [Enterococcus phoeniculicola ATCC BAA-412]EOT79690.1 hypothetical protein I589_01202 [Enterococcus phoeniculicola ATCC BAA-412]